MPRFSMATEQAETNNTAKIGGEARMSAAEDEELQWAGNEDLYSIENRVGREYNDDIKLDEDADLGLRGDTRNMPDSAREWHAFNRSFANKTMGMKMGEVRSLIIRTDSNEYAITAYEYMKGYADAKIQIDTKQAKRRADRKERGYGTNTDRRTADRWLDAVRSDGRGAGGNLSVSANREATVADDRLSGRASRSFWAGDIETDVENYQELEENEERIPGSLVYDGNGRAYEVDQDGNFNEILLDKKVEESDLTPRFSMTTEQDLGDFADWTEEDLRQHIETMDSAENVEYNEMERAAAEAARNFQINFTGEIRKGKSVALSRTEVEAIRHALKSGYGHIEADGERGYVNTWENCYIFEIADGNAVIKYVVGHEENNIHRRKYEEEYGHVGRRRGDWKTGTQTKVERNGQDIGAGDISSSSRIGESGVSDGMDGRASGSDTDGNLEEIERDREDRDSISALSKRARDLSYLLKVEHRFTQEDKRLIRKEIKRLREKIREKMPRFSMAAEQDLEGFADWTEEVLGRRMTPEEFAASMDASKSRPPQGRIKEIVDGMSEKYEHTARDGHLYKDPDMSDEEYDRLSDAWKGRTRPEQWIIPKKRFTSTPAMEKLGIKIDGSVTRYRQTEQMRNAEKENFWRKNSGFDTKQRRNRELFEFSVSS